MDNYLYSINIYGLYFNFNCGCTSGLGGNIFCMLRNITNIIIWCCVTQGTSIGMKNNVSPVISCSFEIKFVFLMNTVLKVY